MRDLLQALEDAIPGKPCPRCGKPISHWRRGYGTLWTSGDDRARHGTSTCHRCPGSYLAAGYTGYVSSLDSPA